MTVSEARPASPPGKRRWFQFSVRTLLVFVLLTSVGLSWFAVRMQQARRQREAVEAIRRHGGRVFYDWELSSVGSAKRTFACLRGFLGPDFYDKVIWVDFIERPCADAVLEQFEGLTELETLLLEDTRVTDAGFRHLEGLANLQRLDLRGSNITDATLEHVRSLSNLEELTIRSEEVTNAGVEHLSMLVNLRKLSLCTPLVTSAGLEPLQGLHDLTELELAGLHVTDVTIADLSKLRRLRRLTLLRTSVTDAGLEHLRELTELEVLSFGFPNSITYEDFEKLQEALPHCEIHF